MAEIALAWTTAPPKSVAKRRAWTSEKSAPGDGFKASGWSSAPWFRRAVDHAEEVEKLIEMEEGGVALHSREPLALAGAPWSIATECDVMWHAVTLGC
jgi:hypothetical protein